jgi:hypothetical protein
MNADLDAVTVGQIRSRVRDTEVAIHRMIHDLENAIGINIHAAEITRYNLITGSRIGNVQLKFDLMEGR